MGQNFSPRFRKNVRARGKNGGGGKEKNEELIEERKKIVVVKETRGKMNLEGKGEIGREEEREREM